MFKPLAQGIDWLLSKTLARFVRPRGEVPRALAVPSDPDEVIWPKFVHPVFQPADLKAAKIQIVEGEEIEEFSFASPVDSPWPENQTVRGLALGSPGARRAIILLHGAYEERYLHPVWMARSFTQHGYRVLIPAGPCHLQRTPRQGEHSVFSGSPMFWSTELFVAALHQWLAEVRGLIGWLRSQGVEGVGLFGYSLGTLVGGLAATLWSDIDLVAMLSPVGSHLDSIEQSRVAARIWPWMGNLPAAERDLLTRWAAMPRRPKVSRLAFFITRYDKLQPTALQEAWWQAWGRPHRRDYAHAHLSVHFCKDFYRDLAALAGGWGWSAAEAPAEPPRESDAQRNDLQMKSCGTSAGASAALQPQPPSARRPGTS